MANSNKPERVWIPGRVCYCADAGCRALSVSKICPSKPSKNGVQLFYSVRRDSTKAKVYLGSKTVSVSKVA